MSQHLTDAAAALKAECDKFEGIPLSKKSYESQSK